MAYNKLFGSDLLTLLDKMCVGILFIISALVFIYTNNVLTIIIMLICLFYKRWLWRLLRTLVIYISILLIPATPSAIMYRLLDGTNQNRISLLDRDIITSPHELNYLLNDRCPLSTDPHALISGPSINFLFFIDDTEVWAKRRAIIVKVTPVMKARVEEFCKINAYTPTTGVRDVYDDIFNYTTDVAFNMLFGRSMTDLEKKNILPGIYNINDYVKRKTINVDIKARQNMTNTFEQLINSEKTDDKFLMNGILDFWKLPIGAQVDICGGDLFHSTAIQTCDLMIHMLLMWKENGKDFLENLTWSIKETLRLYPLSDCFYRYKSQHQNEIPWIAPLILVHRNSTFWERGDLFMPKRWENKKLNTIMLSYSGGQRRCPSANISESIVTAIMESLCGQHMWLQIADGFDHERMLAFGLPAKVGITSTSNHLEPPMEEKIKSLYWPKKRLWIQRYWNRTIRMIRKRDVW